MTSDDYWIISKINEIKSHLDFISQGILLDMVDLSMRESLDMTLSEHIKTIKRFIGGMEN